MVVGGRGGGTGRDGGGGGGRGGGGGGVNQLPPECYIWPELCKPVTASEVGQISGENSSSAVGTLGNALGV